MKQSTQTRIYSSRKDQEFIGASYQKDLSSSSKEQNISQNRRTRRVGRSNTSEGVDRARRETGREQADGDPNSETMSTQTSSDARKGKSFRFRDTPGLRRIMADIYFTGETMAAAAMLCGVKYTCRHPGGESGARESLHSSGCQVAKGNRFHL